MKKLHIALIICAVIIIAVIFGAYYFLLKDEVTELDEDSPLREPNSTLLSSGTFKSTDYDVEGKALLINDSVDLVLRFEDFKTDTGPGLYIYLSTDQGNDDYIDLGEIKAHEGNINYDVPSGTDYEKYNYVLIWCEPFSVLFGYAELE